MPVMVNETRTYTALESAKVSRRPYIRILHAIRDGELKAQKFGGSYVITHPDLQAYLDRYVNVTLP